MQPQFTTAPDATLRAFEVRLAAGIDQTGGPDACWPWKRATNNQGYGIFTIGSPVDGHQRRSLAHRLVYQLTFGDPPPDKPCILHTCDNPSCCNPRHLWAGTVGDNNEDMARKGRHGESKRTHCPAGHPYDEGNTYLEHGRRHCRACMKIRDARRSRERRYRNG